MKAVQIHAYGGLENLLYVEAVGADAVSTVSACLSWRWAKTGLAILAVVFAACGLYNQEQSTQKI